ncbi:MAG TPA: hypothetical protein VIJ93_03565 [bacterium]
MLKKKKNTRTVNQRKAQRRKPGDLRFPGRLIGKREGIPRKGNRRLHERRKK